MDARGTLVNDVKIGSWQMPWNAKVDAGRLADGIPPERYWASDPAGINQVGCIYTAQPFRLLRAAVAYLDVLGRATVPPRLDRGDYALLLLGLLGEREMYGYELVAALRDRSNAVIDLPEGTVYPALRRLEREGLVAGRWVEVAGGPRRRYYSLTAGGERALADGRRAWRRFAAAADGVLGR